MLSLFKSRYYYKDIFPNNYIDIHNHLLPGIDDGAKTIHDTNRLVAQMKAINIAGAIATPHTLTGYWNNSASSIKNAYHMATATDSNRSFLKGYASEYMLDASLIERIKKEPLLCIYEDYIVVELHPFVSPLNLYEMLFELKLQNYKIIIAHPERYLYFHNSPNKYKQLKDYGIHFQLNLLSLIGYYGKTIQKTAEQLLDNDLYDFSGTDIHHQKHIQYFHKQPIRYSNKKKLVALLQNNLVFNK